VQSSLADAYTSELELLLEVLPPHIREALHLLHPSLDELIEIVLDLGRPPEVRFPNSFAYFGEMITPQEIAYVVERISPFGRDNRSGIERTLHRISAMRNRQGKVVGLTLRVGRALYGTVEMIRDVVESGASIMLLGRPGVGKTTLLREAARVAADELHKRVIVVDTSNEIAGDGDIPHPAIGHARRMQVPQVAMQHRVMIEAVENHMPEVVVIDEIGTSEEALAARTIAERGVQLIATAHGISLANLIKNPTLNDLIGGIQAVTLGDEEARRRGSQKTVLERKAAPTFAVLVELQDRQTLVLHPDVANSVDLSLRNLAPEPETRVRQEDGSWSVRDNQPALKVLEGRSDSERNRSLDALDKFPDQPLKIFSIGVNRSYLERIIYKYALPLQLTREMIEADITFALNDFKGGERIIRAYEMGLPVITVRSNTIGAVETAVRNLLRERPEVKDYVKGGSYLDPLEEAEKAIEQAAMDMKPVELRPRDAYTRRLQHELVEQSGLRSRSRGTDPQRRVVIYP